MTKLIAGTVFALVLATGCKKKDDHKVNETGTTAPVNKEGTATAPSTPDTTKVGENAAPNAAPPGSTTPGTTAAAPAKSEYKPDELWTEASTMSNMDRTTRYPKGVTVSGTIKSVKDDPTGEYVVTMDATSGNTVDAMIMDPKDAKAAKLKAGDSVTLKNCTIANTQGTSMPLRNCEYSK